MIDKFFKAKFQLLTQKKNTIRIIKSKCQETSPLCFPLLQLHNFRHKKKSSPDAEKIPHFPGKSYPNNNIFSIFSTVSSPSMIPENPIHISPKFPLLLLLLISSVNAEAEAKCSKSCGSGHRPHDFPHPIGFSAACQIRLNCTRDGAALIGEFPVESINSDHIKVMMGAKCNRRLHAIRQFFSRNYAPTAHNAILLQNCSSPVSSCLLPTTMVQTKFESPNCASVNASSISCYTQNGVGFLDLENLTRTHCDYLLSSISAESLSSNSSAGISLEIQAVELEWWLEGGCRRSCHEDANCTELISPTDGRPSHRCHCPEGLVGDGYSAGTGCRKG